MTKLVVVLSGGLDSTVLLAHLAATGAAARAVTVDYGQRHAREIESAKKVALHYSVPHDIVDLRALRAVLPGNSQTGDLAVPHGHYEDATMRLTVVPNRNMMLLSVALGIAVAHDVDGVAYGAHAGDHAIYPDCRQPFIAAMEVAAKLCDYKPRHLVAPFASIDKTAIVRRGVELGVPLNLTWTCYEGGQEHCGRCGACNERREAFMLADVADPTTYEGKA